MDLDNAPLSGEDDVAAPHITDPETKQWAMYLHLSTLAGYAVPMAGLVAPIIIWQLKKDQMPGIDAHGKMVMNFIISYFLWSVICVLLAFALIGIPMLMALGVAAIVLPIIGGIKANDGVLWKYPLTIEFLK